MALLFGEDERVTGWVATQLGYAEPPPAYAAIGYTTAQGDLCAGVYFDGMTGTNLFTHIASTTEMLPPSLLVATAYYAFHQCGAKRMTLMVADDNAKSKKLCADLGAEFEAKLRDGHPGGDVYMYALWRKSPFIAKLVSTRRLPAFEEA